MAIGCSVLVHLLIWFLCSFSVIVCLWPQRADMVIEAAIEDIPLKQKIFAGGCFFFVLGQPAFCRLLWVHGVTMQQLT